jgi:NitT/TauT family transport system substrate-binding protein
LSWPTAKREESNVFRRAFIASALAAVLVVASAAGAQAQGKKFTFILDFLPYGEYSPFFTALAKGWYKEDGLDVEILRGAGSADTVKRLVAGQGHAGTADLTSLISAISNEDVKAKMIGAYLRRPSNAIFVRADSGINSMKDLVDKKIAITPGNSHLVLWPIVAAKAGIAVDSVNWVTMDGAAMGPALISKQVDAAPFGAQHEARLQKQAKEMANTSLKKFLYADYGLEIYSLSIVATDESIKTNGPDIKKFLKATIRALEYCWGEKRNDECAKNVVDANPVVDMVAAVGASTVAGSLSFTSEVRSGKVALGQIEPERVTMTRDTAVQYLKLKKTVPIEQLFTNDLLPAKK